MKLYIIQLHVSNFICGTYTKCNCKDCDTDRKMCNPCLSVNHTQSSNFCTVKNNHPYYHPHITVLFVEHGQGEKCHRSSYFLYLSMCCCSLAFWFKGPMFESYCRQTICEKGNLQVLLYLEYTHY